MVVKKYASKRINLKTKYKIEKKVLEHHRKQRKLAKKGNLSQKKRLSKDPGIPNIHPYKEQLLKQMEKKNQRMKDQEKLQHKLRSEAHAERRGLGNNSRFETMLADAKKRTTEFQRTKGAKEINATVDAAGSQNRRAYARELKKVVESSDVILEVLDARDPMGCRVQQLEQMILGKYPGKRIVLVLNKVDMVPRPAMLGWMRYLRNSFPCVAFKANTAESGRHLGRAGGDASKAKEGALSGNSAVGAEQLMQMLKNYCRGKESGSAKRAVTVGVVGFPNVGKSSVINSLKRARATGVSPVAGFTKVMQEVQLDSKIRLLDCPGVILESSSAGLLLRNVLSVEALPDGDAVPAVTSIVKRCPPEQLMKVYSIARFSSPAEFLVHVARKRGKVKRGGIVDTPSAARLVLHDWNSGKIPFFTPPPAPDAQSQAVSSASAQIVSSWASEFDPEKLLSVRVEQPEPSAADVEEVAEGEYGFVTLDGEGDMGGNDIVLSSGSDENDDVKDVEEDSSQESSSGGEDEEEDMEVVESAAAPATGSYDFKTDFYKPVTAAKGKRGKKGGKKK